MKLEMNNELEKILEWFRANKLSINSSKTKFSLFHPSFKKKEVQSFFPKLFIENKEIGLIDNITTNKWGAKSYGLPSSWCTSLSKSVLQANVIFFCVFQIDGQTLVWNQIISLYDWDIGIDRDAVGLTMFHKLSEEHINLNSRTRMRVNLAVQVLSSTVADMLEEQGLHSTKSLIKFIRMMDKFFDCLNVSKIFNYSRKPDLDRYKAIDDIRFDWLQNTFLSFINSREEQCQNIPNLSQAEKNRFCLSKQTLEGLRITVNSFTTLAKFLLVEGAEYILSEKFCQDPLEEYFGKQRMRLGCNDNPLLIEFNSNALALNVSGDNLIRVFGSNTKGRKNEFQKLDVKNTDLPSSKKRKK
ncbi:uncharacterized protein LOC136096407 [Hydra vulgaris]|uniref:uncharacterized protein LOC136096407 n=1 Tax=Hydra vulgaris TaxID=6087 RepID=UPI0032EA804B